jgi:DNA-binding XRE family transcriptional regulator
MNKIKTINSDILLKKQMKNNEFKKEYNELEGEFKIAKEIIKLRRNADLTQKQLAKLAGTSQPAIARLESGNYKNLSLSSLRKIGKALGATPEIHFKKIKAS